MSDILEQVEKILLTKDSNLRNDFIIQYKPFVLKCVSKTAGRYISSESDDLFIIGLESFNQSIDQFNSDKGSFISFAERVIKSRVIDYLRKEKKIKDRVVSDNEYIMSRPSPVDEDLVQEINILKNQLKVFGINMEDLMKTSPKQKDVRLQVTDLGQKIAKDKNIVDSIYLKRKLPVSEIALKFSQSKKRLKLFKPYLIGIVIIYKEELLQIQSFLVLEVME